MQVVSTTTQRANKPMLYAYKNKAYNTSRYDLKKDVINLNSDPKAALGRNLAFKGNIKPSISEKDLKSILSEIIESDQKSERPLIKSVNSDFASKIAQKIAQDPKKNILIGISGESASGKSEICKTIRKAAEKLNIPIETISADNYFKDISALIAKYGSFNKVIEAGVDVDSPGNFNLEQLFKDLKTLAEGKDVKIPEYLIDGTGRSVPDAIPKKAQKIIIIEGLATLYDPVRSLLDAEIFIDIDPEIQKERYIKRAVSSRNQTEQEALEHLKYTIEAARKYLHPKKANSDIIIDGATELTRYSQIIKSLQRKIKTIEFKNTIRNLITNFGSNFKNIIRNLLKLS